MEIPTVRIKSTHPASQGPFVEINKTDFDPSKHELFDAPPPPPPEIAPPPPPPPVIDPLADLASNWRDRHDLRELAARVTGRAVENKRQAIQVIEAELDKRAALAAGD